MGQPPWRVLTHSSLSGQQWTRLIPPRWLHQGDGRTGGEAEDHREFFRWSLMGPHPVIGKGTGMGVGRADRESGGVQALQALMG